MSVRVNNQDLDHCAAAVVNAKDGDFRAMHPDDKALNRLIVRDVLQALEERGYQLIRKDRK